jgi:hypothetical protein
LILATLQRNEGGPKGGSVSELIPLTTRLRSVVLFKNRNRVRSVVVSKKQPAQASRRMSPVEPVKVVERPRAAGLAYLVGGVSILLPGFMSLLVHIASVLHRFFVLPLQTRPIMLFFHFQWRAPKDLVRVTPRVVALLFGPPIVLLKA